MEKLFVKLCHIYTQLPGRMVRLELLLNAKPSMDTILHRTIVPLFSDVAGTVRLDRTVPENGSVAVSEVIPRFSMMGSVDSDLFTSHTIVKPAPAQLN